MRPSFSYSDYRQFLRARAEEWGEITRLAKAAQCQQSYLSRAIKGDVLLTPDHLHGLCEYWELPEDEAEYLHLLLEKARASTSAYRSRVELKLAKILRERENLARRLETPRIEATEREVLYYSNWHWVAVHLCTSVPALQTESAIAQALHLPVSLVKETLLKLSEWGLVRREGRLWTHSPGNLHLPKKSPLIAQHHRHWRSKAADDSLVPDGNGLHYTQIQSMDTAAFQEIKNIILASIDRTLSVADTAISERVVAISMDVFEIV